MMTKALTVTGGAIPKIRIVPEGTTGNRLSRLSLFEGWLDDTRRAWHDPDLAAYRDHLLQRMTPRSAKSHLATIRGRYGELINDNGTRDLLYTMAGAEVAALGQEDTIANRKAVVDELLARLANGTDPKHSAVKVETVQDEVDSAVGLRLTRDQASALLASPGLIPIDKLRDTAILAVFLCTGVRCAELCSLEVKDLRETLDGKLCLHVRKGKGCKTRAIPWGAGQWALAYVDRWLEAAGIVEGPVFRGFYKPKVDGSRKLRKGRLSVRAVQKIVEQYPQMVDGEMTQIHVHDLRRTYARRCYDEGMSIMAIQQNLGHSDHKTTEHYIGVLDAETRQPPSLYNPPHWAELERLEIQGRIDDSEGA